MPALAYKTPGVYIQEPNSFPPSIVGVETAVPAFIGYTATAVDANGISLHLIPRRVESMMEFVSFFGGPFRQQYVLNPAAGAAPAAGASPAAGAAPAAAPAAIPNGQIAIGGQPYAITPKAATHFYLYNSLLLFFANSGGPCYIVSCGSFADAAAGVGFNDLDAGLDACANLIGPTMLVVPDAMLLGNGGDFDKVVAKMLQQCQTVGDRVALLDVYGTDKLTPASAPSVYQDQVEAFRTGVGAVNPGALKYGAAYFPALTTSIVGAGDIDLRNFDVAALGPVLDLAVADLYPDIKDRADGTGAATVPDPKATAIKEQFTGKLAGLKNTEPLSPVELETLNRVGQGISRNIPVYGQILAVIAKFQNILPPSGAMAGIYAGNDTFLGVWNAPANVGIVGMVAPTYPISGHQQDNLNLPISGLAVNAIRTFPGRGNVVWGARTLDGNSNDWRYVQIRRTMIYVEQSIKDALERMVFAPNTAQTWTTVTSMIESFLHGLWAAGGLMGASPAEAYSVAAGLGTTMTPQDVLSGVMKVKVVLQMIHPAEFIELTFQQKMGGGA